ncbi:hypothetical protein LWI29_019279 [Acer saccharum]|uniref:Uncharacterized protein n=1 Tax=Acer saccharum TaxID=4024 RepID=A0AA39TFR3_ACESA|nr:hypothetical protein LWI29_019279 [Acer saccharum]
MGLSEQPSPVKRGPRNNQIKIQEAGKLGKEVLQRFRVGQKWQQLQLLEDPVPLLLVLFSKQQPEESPRSHSPTIPFPPISLSAVSLDHSLHLFLPGCFDENWPLLFLSTPPFQLLVLSPSSPAKLAPLIKVDLLIISVPSSSKCWRKSKLSPLKYGMVFVVS